MLVHFVQLDDVDLGSLDDLDLSDGDVLEWENLLAFLGDFFGDLLHGESLDDLIDRLFSDLGVQQGGDSFSDLSDVRAGGVGLLLDLS